MLIQENKATCPMAIRDAKAQKASQAKLLQKEHGNIMWDLERQVIQEEVRSQADFLFTCQAAMYTSLMALKNALATFLPHSIRADTSFAPFHSITKGLPSENSWLQLPLSHQCLNSPLGPKEDALPQILWRACPWAEPLWRQPRRTPSSKQWETCPGTEHSSQVGLRFGQDLDLVKESQGRHLLETFLQLCWWGNLQSLWDISSRWPPMLSC